MRATNLEQKSMENNQVNDRNENDKAEANHFHLGQIRQHDHCQAQVDERDEEQRRQLAGPRASGDRGVAREGAHPW